LVGVLVAVAVAVSVGVSVGVKVAVGVALGPEGVLVAKAAGGGVFVPGSVICTWAALAPPGKLRAIRLMTASMSVIQRRIKIPV
jgi:hypothetical protein